MRVRRLGTSGPELSMVGFGAWAIGGPWRFGWGSVDDDESVAAIRHAVELGVNWVDTAAVYGLGHSEEVVGRALAPYRVGEDVFVFTKCGRRWEGRPDGVIENDLRPESIREECERSLRRLGVERIDLYQFHWPDWTTGTALEDSWAAMVELVEQGKARWIGVANFDVDQLARCEAMSHVASVQPPLSLLTRGARDDRPPLGRRARNRRDRLLADGLGTPHRQRRSRSDRPARLERLASGVSAVPSSPHSDETSISWRDSGRSRPASVRRSPSCPSHGPSPRPE